MTQFLDRFPQSNFIAQQIQMLQLGKTILVGQVDVFQAAVDEAELGKAEIEIFKENRSTKIVSFFGLKKVM